MYNTTSTFGVKMKLMWVSKNVDQMFGKLYFWNVMNIISEVRIFNKILIIVS